MSYGLDFAPDAHSQWRELDPELQESVLDELDRLTDNPPPAPDEVVRDFVGSTAGGDHCIFVRAVIDRRRRIVTLTGVVDVPRDRGA